MIRSFEMKSLVLLLAFCSSAAAGELVVRLSDRHVEVTGKPEDVDRFFHNWQTELWPEWRIAKSDAARKQYEQALPTIQSGSVTLSTADRFSSAAFWNQLKAWDGDWTIRRAGRDSTGCQCNPCTCESCTCGK